MGEQVKEVGVDTYITNNLDYLKKMCFQSEKLHYSYEKFDLWSFCRYYAYIFIDYGMIHYFKSVYNVDVQEYDLKGFNFGAGKESNKFHGIHLFLREYQKMKPVIYDEGMRILGKYFDMILYLSLLDEEKLGGYTNKKQAVSYLNALRKNVYTTCQNLHNVLSGVYDKTGGRNSSNYRKLEIDRVISPDCYDYVIELSSYIDRAVYLANIEEEKLSKQRDNYVATNLDLTAFGLDTKRIRDRNLANVVNVKLLTELLRMIHFDCGTLETHSRYGLFRARFDRDFRGRLLRLIDGDIGTSRLIGDTVSFNHIRTLGHPKIGMVNYALLNYTVKEIGRLLWCTPYARDSDMKDIIQTLDYIGIIPAVNTGDRATLVDFYRGDYYHIVECKLGNNLLCNHNLKKLLEYVTLFGKSNGNLLLKYHRELLKEDGAKLAVIVGLYLGGKSITEIGHILRMSNSTVDTYLQRVRLENRSTFRADIFTVACVPLGVFGAYWWAQRGDCNLEEVKAFTRVTMYKDSTPLNTLPEELCTDFERTVLNSFITRYKHGHVNSDYFEF